MTLSSEAIRARRAELRRRRTRRRRMAALAMCVLLGAAALGVVLVSRSGAHAKGSPAGSAAAAMRSRGRLRGRHGPPLRTPAERTALVRARESKAIDRLLARQPFISAGGPEQREIALTFDDGPGPYTPQVLDQLRRLHAPGTFFEIGFMFRWFHAAATEALEMNDVIGDHTETHPRMALLSEAAQRAEILDQTKWVRSYGGPFPRLWRPPYGSYNSTTLTILGQLHMLMVLWTVDTDDYLRPGVGVIVHRVLAGARPGAIILLHDGGGDRTQTIAALPLIVHALRARGYKLVTIPRLVMDDPPIAVQTLPTHVSGD